jgi:hypothetical protein
MVKWVNRIVFRVGQYADASHLRLIGESDPDDPYQLLMQDTELEESAEPDQELPA